MKNSYEITDYELGIKRFYLPVEFNVKCSCGNIETVDMEKNYLCYPSIGLDEKGYWCCRGCGKEHSYNVKLNVSIDIDCPEFTEEETQ